MRIGISCYPTYGGSGVVATELGKALARRGHEVHFISYAMPMRLEGFSERIFYHEVPIVQYPLFEYPPYDLNLASKMVDAVRFAHLELLHVHYAIPHATSAYLAKQILAEEGIRIPVITTLHGTDITLVGQDPSFEPVVRFSINQSDAVTAVSEYLRRETEAHFRVRVPIVVIPNFVDTERFRPINKAHFKQALCPNGEKVLVHISNFRPLKRVSDAVWVLVRLLERGLQAKLLLVGDGPERTQVEQLCRELAACEAVRFLGKQEPVEEILAIADLFLMPSASETFGLAALEAMACGVPVISTDAGGLPELIRHGETGFLCPVGDVTAMAEHAYEVLTNPALQERLRAQARAWAVSRYGIEQIVPRYEALYEAVIARPTVPS
ncbi:MAG: N-acetyl-alpha-D-glucosaminyl L-malate synthase BshA [Bacteroidetes bacterium]|nr:N-acetyl-alpha-D-glucosaminyl L-malate synthase BshA [Rhodothermia bacterium]MCS7154359.1 N-acetyl-alpha-D-glucosaminyl L-malate synthase BshA [Bacteroidota bacterium]MCX7907604.1 N-acetyl-alpha-D-glucosaminyl L-malate synthase BshA [Bacteroidota bacterium]MDW8137734.1 N-acetyl-alpha-D-glucosaminyl L-malate synthase BshA [Bacteroidota bacterium]MDW8286433.1 N-acetyl-alpha-D-glucosaminyl L-malate synthase BshA [Bacteroidota bacterium]